MLLRHGRAGIGWPARTVVHVIVLHAAIAFVWHAGAAVVSHAGVAFVAHTGVFMLLHASVAPVLHRFVTHLHPASRGRRLERRWRRWVGPEHGGHGDCRRFRRAWIGGVAARRQRRRKR